MSLTRMLVKEYLEGKEEARKKVRELLKDSYEKYYLKNLEDPISTNIGITNVEEINSKVKEALKKINEKENTLQEEIKSLRGENE